MKLTWIFLVCCVSLSIVFDTTCAGKIIEKIMDMLPESFKTKFLSFWQDPRSVLTRSTPSSLPESNPAGIASSTRTNASPKHGHTVSVHDRSSISSTGMPPPSPTYTPATTNFVRSTNMPISPKNGHTGVSSAGSRSNHSPISTTGMSYPPSQMNGHPRPVSPPKPAVSMPRTEVSSPNRNEDASRPGLYPGHTPISPTSMSHFSPPMHPPTENGKIVFPTPSFPMPPSATSVPFTSTNIIPENHQARVSRPEAHSGNPRIPHSSISRHSLPMHPSAGPVSNIVFPPPIVPEQTRRHSISEETNPHVTAGAVSLKRAPHVRRKSSAHTPSHPTKEQTPVPAIFDIACQQNNEFSHTDSFETNWIVYCAGLMGHQDVELPRGIIFHSFHNINDTSLHFRRMLLEEAEHLKQRRNSHLQNIRIGSLTSTCKKMETAIINGCLIGSMGIDLSGIIHEMFKEDCIRVMVFINQIMTRDPRHVRYNISLIRRGVIDKMLCGDDRTGALYRLCVYQYASHHKLHGNELKKTFELNAENNQIDYLWNPEDLTEFIKRIEGHIGMEMKNMESADDEERRLMEDELKFEANLVWGTSLRFRSMLLKRWEKNAYPKQDGTLAPPTERGWEIAAWNALEQCLGIIKKELNESIKLFQKDQMILTSLDDSLLTFLETIFATTRVKLEYLRNRNIIFQNEDNRIKGFLHNNNVINLDAQRKNAAVNVASICLFATDVLKTPCFINV